MRRRHWRRFGTAGAALCLLGATAATAGAAGATSAPHSRTESHVSFGSHAVSTVTFWSRAATEAIPNALVKKFNATHSNLKIVLHLTQPNEASSQLATAIRAGDPPDLVGLNDINVPAFAREGALMNLTKLVDSLPYKSELSPGHMKLGKIGNQYYALPYLADLSVLWYNTKLFKEAGISGPPTTFASILADAKKISALGHGVYGFSFAGNCQGCLGFVMLPEIWASGQHLINGPLGKQTANVANNAPLKALLNVYRQIWADKLVPPSDQTDNGSTWGDNFAKGIVGIEPGDYGFVTKYLTGPVKGDFKDVPLPGMNGGFSTFDGGDDFVIPKGAKNPTGAMEVIKWFLEKSQQEQYPALGDTPIRSDILSKAFVAKYPYDGVALKALHHGSVEYTLAYNQVFNAPGSPWFKMFEQAVYSGDVPGALKSGQANIQSTLNSAAP